VSRLAAVTGASGYLGGRCAAALRAAGWEVRRLVRTPVEPGDRPFRLGEPVDPDALRGADVLIHAAHDFKAYGPEAFRVNVSGAEALLKAAQAAGVGRIVAVSSVSAFAGCRSEYGRAKLALEEAVAGRGGISVRPGLIYGGGKGGMFGTLARLCRLPVIPLPDGGRQPLFLAHADDVAAALVAATGWGPAAAPVTLAHPEPVPFRDILRALARGQGKKPFFAPFPSAVMLGALGAAEAAGLRLPARRDSLLGLLYGNPDPDFAAARRLGLSFRRFLEQEPASLLG
jgi:nucleoside-diphosphate-sugar epimerase